MSPLDENHHALLIRLYRMAGDEAAASASSPSAPSAGARARDHPGRRSRPPCARRRVDQRGDRDPYVDRGAGRGRALPLSPPGPPRPGVESLRAAVRMSDLGDHARLRVSTRLALADTLVHSVRGLDEEGMATLLAADDIAGTATLPRWRRPVPSWATWTSCGRGTSGPRCGSRRPATSVPAIPRSRRRPRRTWGRSRATAPTTSAPCATSPRPGGWPGWPATGGGRPTPLRCSAASTCSGVTGRGRDGARHRRRAGLREHWLAFLPWPQALRGELELARGDVSRSAEVLDQAFARACQLGDPCWEGISGRGLALAAEARGETDLAFELLADARLRSNRLSDPYVWLDGYILDAQCTLGLRHGHPETADWVDALRLLASRTGMRELNVRSMLHGRRPRPRR